MTGLQGALRCAAGGPTIRTRTTTASVVAAALALLALTSPAVATVPGTNGKIAYALDSIHAVQPDGSGLTRLTSAPRFDGDNEPDWSPDGSRVAFTRPTFCCPLQADIWVVGTDGSAAVGLTSGATWDRAPQWSPDGARILFTRNHDLWVMNADGTGQAPLLADATGGSWSPDGTRIAFVSGREVHVMRADGTGVSRLTTITRDLCDPVPDANRDPEWSPDGRQIAYVFTIDVFGCPEDYMSGDGLRVIGAQGSGDTLLVPAQQFSVLASPSWSPDGTRIAFERDGSTFIVSVTGGPETPVPGTGWSPDWQSIPAGPQRSDYKNAAHFCKAERAFLGEAAFARRYGGAANAHGRCVSGRPNQS